MDGRECALRVQVSVPVCRAPLIKSPAVCQARSLGAAAKAESAFEPALEEAEPVNEAVQAAEDEVAGETTLEVDAAAVADESLKIVNCNLTDSTIKVQIHCLAHLHC